MIIIWRKCDEYIQMGKMHYKDVTKVCAPTCIFTVYIGYKLSFLYHLFHEADFSPFNCEVNCLLENRYFQVQQTIFNIYSLIIQNNISEK